MRLPDENYDLASRPSAGEEFVKKIGIFGAVLFLVLSIIGTLLMFAAGRAPAPSENESNSAFDVPSLYTSHHQLF